MSQFSFDPATYLGLMESEVPHYRALQDAVAEASVGRPVTRLLDLGTGTGETLAAVLARHSGATALGLDKNPGMLDAARRTAAPRVSARRVPSGRAHRRLAVRPLRPGRLGARRPPPLEPPEVALFVRLAEVLAPGGRFVLGDVVLPEDPADAVTPLNPDHDPPDTLADQHGWLATAGFEATFFWRAGDLVVLRAERAG